MTRLARLGLIVSLGLSLAAGPWATNSLAQSKSEPLDRFDSTTGPVLIGAISDKLAELGFYKGPHVASVTPALGEAIARYRRQAGMPAGSYADQELINRLNFGPVIKPAVPSKTVRSDNSLRHVQERLSALGFYNAAIDGRDGPLTREAIKQFQAQHDMAIDGAITADLLDRLDKAD